MSVIQPKTVCFWKCILCIDNLNALPWPKLEFKHFWTRTKSWKMCPPWKLELRPFGITNKSGTTHLPPHLNWNLGFFGLRNKSWKGHLSFIKIWICLFGLRNKSWRIQPLPHHNRDLGFFGLKNQVGKCAPQLTLGFRLNITSCEISGDLVEDTSKSHLMWDIWRFGWRHSLKTLFFRKIQYGSTRGCSMRSHQKRDVRFSALCKAYWPQTCTHTQAETIDG